jgi:hypothetical protein
MRGKTASMRAAEDIISVVSNNCESNGYRGNKKLEQLLSRHRKKKAGSIKFRDRDHAAGAQSYSELRNQKKDGPNGG